MTNKKVATQDSLKSLHGWFMHLCKYDSSAWADRLYAEGQIYACRELINDFQTKYGSMSRGFMFMPEYEPFMSGYNAFKKTYTTT